LRRPERIVGPPDRPARIRGGVRRFGGLAALLLAGCRMGPFAAPPSPPAPPPDLPPLRMAPVPLPSPASRRAAPGTVPRERAPSLDPLLDSPWVRAAPLQDRVEYWIASFRTRERRFLEASLARMARYGPRIAQALRDEGLPDGLLYLPLVESGYEPRAVSRAGAAGLWQLMPGTARLAGLRVDRLVDERRDPLVSTRAALRYLAELRGRFGSWFLALAAYNSGPGRVQRALRRRGVSLPADDDAFWRIRSLLPRETREFVPRFLAAAFVARDPAAYGFAGVPPLPPLAFEEVEVPDAVTLDVVARAAEAPQRVVEELNPHVVRGLTPPGERMVLRVPAGAGERFARNFAGIPPEERVTFLEHAVRKGETLSHIALRYGVTVADLQAANPRVRPRFLRIGQRIVIPKAPSARASLRSSGGS